MQTGEPKRSEEGRVVFHVESLATSWGEDWKSVHNFLDTGRKHNKGVMGNLF